MFNRLSEYAKNDILTEFKIPNIRELDGLSSQERESLRSRLRNELNSVMNNLIINLDNEALERLSYVLKKHWNHDTINTLELPDFDCILVHNYIHGRHCIQ